MKYQKPQLRVITKASANAVCSDGSSATSFEACNSGSSASGGCVANGSVATVSNCLDGSSASYFGSTGCQIGFIPDSTEECVAGSTL